MANDQEASSSNSSNPNPTQACKYDIFLSFRGEDTRRGFIDHLYSALYGRGFRVFIDTELERGEVISEELLRAIESSRCAIVVISENYGRSSWCLDELQHILDSRNELGQQVFPIFYRVNPSDVRHQRGSFAEAFEAHRILVRDEEKVQNWRNSLMKVANLSGWDSRDWYEAQLIENVVQHLWIQVGCKLPSYSDTLVGTDWRLHQMESYFGKRLDGVLFLGIWGMGGIGKSTLARAIYERFQSHFNYCYFLANIREVSERDGEVHFQKKLLSHLKITNLEIEDTYEGKSKLRNFFCNRKVMLILDDVSSISQLENLAGGPKWFGDGSRVIITTRDRHLLISHNVDEIYEVKPMNHDESLQLFCQKAFRRDRPEEGFLELSELVVEYASGVPLALCVLGSFFRGRSAIEWKDGLDMLKRDSNNDIFKILRISYNALSRDQQAVFLDIACFFNMWGKDEVTKILESCGLHATIGMITLTEKSLLTEVEIGNSKYIEMHHLVQEMGRTIVFEESRYNVALNSRLWSPTDIDKVLKKNMGTEATEGVVLPFGFAKDEAHWNPFAFSKLSRLRLLIISCNLDLPRGLKDLSGALHVLHWYGYPLEDLPSEAKLEGLVYLKMQNSKIKRLSLDRQFVINLRFLDLSYSKNFIETPEFYEFECLERLVLEG